MFSWIKGSILPESFRTRHAWYMNLSGIFELYTGGNSLIPYTIKIFIIRHKWVINVLYISKVEDSYSFTRKILNIFTIQESNKTVDTVNWITALLTSKILNETSTLNDSYNYNTASLTGKSISETSTISDTISKFTANLTGKILNEISNIDDSYNESRKTLTSKILKETLHSTDIINRTIRRLKHYIYGEKVKCNEINISNAPWSENPSILRYSYNMQEKILPVDESLWYYIKNGVRIGGYIDPNGVGYSYKGRFIEESEKPKDMLTTSQYTEWVLAKKYDGYSNVDIIYNAKIVKYDGYSNVDMICNAKIVKYDGYSNTEVIYNAKIVKYNGYCESSITIS